MLHSSHQRIFWRPLPSWQKQSKSVFECNLGTQTGWLQARNHEFQNNGWSELWRVERKGLRSQWSKTSHLGEWEKKYICIITNQYMAGWESFNLWDMRLKVQFIITFLTLYHSNAPYHPPNALPTNKNTCRTLFVVGGGSQNICCEK